MKVSRFLPTAAALVTLATLAAAFQPPAPQPTPGQPGTPGGPGERAGRPDGRFGPQGGGPGGGSVEGSMKGMNRAIKQLKNQVGDSSKREENLRLVNDAQRGLVGAKGLPLPEDILKEAKDDAAKSALKELYRKDLIVGLRKLVEIEQAIFDNKTDDAKKMVDELLMIRDESHKAMGMKDE